MGNAPSTQKVAPGDVFAAPWDLGKAPGGSLQGAVKKPGQKTKKQSPGVNLLALKRIDEHVRKTPPAATKSLQSLADYLSSAATNDLEKARAAYRWITVNVSYDTDGFFKKKEKFPCDAESVLKNRICVCSGFASLMLGLCQLMSVECVKINGYSKGVDYDPTTPLEALEADHAWNAVKIDGKWRFIESTWGAGTINDQQQFVRNPTDFHFLTDPDIFIESHFPHVKCDTDESKKWQLLETPIDLKNFHSRVGRQTACIEHQVELVSHKQTLIDVDGEVTLKFRGTGRPLTGFCAKFVNPGTRGEKLSSGRHIATVLDHRTNEATVTVRPPTRGVYWQLDVFGSTDDDAKLLDGIVSYRLRDNAAIRLPEFPDYSDYYGLHGSLEKHGFTSDSLVNKLCSSQGFWLKVDRGVHVMRIPILKPMEAAATLLFAEDSEPDLRASALEVTNKFLTISLRMRRAGFYKLDVFGRNFDSCGSKQPKLVSFLVECAKPLRDRILFPDFEGFYGICRAPSKFGFTCDFQSNQRFYIREADGQFELKCPTFIPVAAVASLTTADEADGKHGSSFLETDEASLKVSLRMDRKAFYILTLYCKKLDSASSEFPMFANFLIKCVKPLKQLKPFPESCTSALVNQVTLESPRDGELPANSQIRFKLASPTLKMLLVNDSVHSRTGPGFNFVARTGAAGTDLTVYGTAEKNAELYESLYKFRVV